MVGEHLHLLYVYKNFADGKIGENYWLYSVHCMMGFLIAWFNDCVLVKSGQIANPIIAMVNPVLYCSIHTFLLANLLIANVGKTHNSQLIDTHNYNKNCPTVASYYLCKIQHLGLIIGIINMCTHQKCHLKVLIIYFLHIISLQRIQQSLPSQ